MKKSDAVQAVAEKVRIPKAQALATVNALLEVMQEALIEGETVDLSGFGRFSITARPERQGRNPATGEPLTIPASRSATFKSSSGLKQALNAPQ